MAMNRVKQIHEFGQSIWLDFIDRKIMDSGELQQLIDEDGLRGITSNPAIFEKAVSSSRDYDADISELAQTITDDEELFYALAVKDIQRAADLFHFIYEEKVRGSDGYVRLEVSPLLARDTNGTVAQALHLWDTIDPEHLMNKIPGTAEGLPAIDQCIAKGLNINVTLLFGLERYEAVVNAYLIGGKPGFDASDTSLYLNLIFADRLGPGPRPPHPRLDGPYKYNVDTQELTYLVPPSFTALHPRIAKHRDAREYYTMFLIPAPARSGSRYYLEGNYQAYEVNTVTGVAS